MISPHKDANCNLKSERAMCLVACCRIFVIALSQMSSVLPPMLGLTMAMAQGKLIQSQHPYRQGMDRHRSLHINGAIGVLVRFHDSCCTLLGDYLEVYEGPDKQGLVMRYEGPGVWKDCMVQGDTVYFFFHSESRLGGDEDTEWGYCCACSKVW